MLSQKLDKQKKGKEKTEKGRQTVDKLTDCYSVYPCNSPPLCSSVFLTSVGELTVCRVYLGLIPSRLITYILYISRPKCQTDSARIASKQTKLQKSFVE